MTAEHSQPTSPGTALATAEPRAAGTLAVYDKITDIVAYCNDMGESTAAMIGCDLRAGKAMALLLARRGWDVMDFIETFHWIQGRPVKKSKAILDSFAKRGGKHRVVQSTPDVAELELTDKEGHVTTWTTTWEQAQQENWPWVKGAGPGSQPIAKNLKDNWATPIGRENMLWWRTVSRACNRVDPGSVSGIPLEETDYIEGVSLLPAVEGSPSRSAKKTAKQIAMEAAAEDAATRGDTEAGDAAAAVGATADVGGTDATSGDPESGDESDVVDGQFTTAAAAGETATATTAVEEPATDTPKGTIRRDQIKAIRELFGELWPTTWEASLQKAVEKRGHAELAQFSAEQAKELIGNLRDRKKQQQAAGN